MPRRLAGSVPQGVTAREGEALSLVSADEAGQLADIEKLLGRRLAREELEGYEPRLSGLGQVQVLP